MSVITGIFLVSGHHVKPGFRSSFSPVTTEAAGGHGNHGNTTEHRAWRLHHRQTHGDTRWLLGMVVWMFFLVLYDQLSMDWIVVSGDDARYIAYIMIYYVYIYIYTFHYRILFDP